MEIVEIKLRELLGRKNINIGCPYDKNCRPGKECITPNKPCSQCWLEYLAGE